MEEYINIVDENGLELNISKSRKYVHKNGFWHKASGVIIMNSQNKILLQQRSIKKEKNAGLYDISVAGHIPSGESPEESLIREIKEELGIITDNEKLKLLGIYKRQELHDNGNFIENEFDYIYILKEDINLSMIKLQTEEVQDVKYFSINVLKHLLSKKLVVKRVGVWDDLFKQLTKE